MRLSPNTEWMKLQEGTFVRTVYLSNVTYQYSSMPYTLPFYVLVHHKFFVRVSYNGVAMGVFPSNNLMLKECLSLNVAHVNRSSRACYVILLFKQRGIPPL
jgi:hypothetical protein